MLKVLPFASCTTYLFIVYIILIPSAINTEAVERRRSGKNASRIHNRTEDFTRYIRHAIVTVILYPRAYKVTYNELRHVRVNEVHFGPTIVLATAYQ